MNWWLIALLVVLVIVVFKFKEIRHKLGFFFVILLLLFVGTSFIQIYTTNSVDLNSFNGIVSAGQLYFAWLANAFSNVMQVGGYAIKQNWSAALQNATSVSS